jgi:serine/threonine-protein phosphatase 2B catalytic subunit
MPFLKKNNVLAIIRAHESLPDGYKMHRWNGTNDFPMVITVFSAPNYCDVYKNKGAIVKFENNTLNIQQYNSAKHPYHLQNFMDVFAWSIPYVSTKIIEMILSICKKGVAEEVETEDKDKVPLSVPKSRLLTHNHCRE